MSDLTRRVVLPGFLLAAGLSLARGALAQPTDGAASPSATTTDDDEEGTSPDTSAKGPPTPVAAPAKRKPAEPDASMAEDEVDAPADHWETFTNGRIGAFVTWAKGEGMPAGTTYDLQTGAARHQVDTTAGGTGSSSPQSSRVVRILPGVDGNPGAPLVDNSIDSMRIRSGFTGNVLGVGVKRRLGGTKVTGYVSVTTVVDSVSQRKYFQSPADFREGYIKLEGKWGSVLLGRAASLFNRGAVETDFLYLHGYGAGFPGDLDSAGGFPTGGQIGFGVLANGYAAGLVYSTPKLAGIQLSAGVYDPSTLNGTQYERTKYLRPEFELTVDEPLGSIGRVHAYFNGGYQPNYRRSDTDDSVGKLMGVGYGARVEVGPVHVGVGGHRGRALGLLYPGLQSATSDVAGTLRDTEGVFVMGQIVIGKFDFNGGYGKSTVHMTPIDLTGDPTSPDGDPKSSIINTQAATSAAIVFHATDWLHFDVDVMHADSEWDLGEHQRINFYNSGTTITW